MNRRRFGWIAGILALLALGGGWLAGPGSQVALPNGLRGRTSQREAVLSAFIGPPPAGTRWRHYRVPMAYRDVVAAFGQTGDWKGASGVLAMGPGGPRCDFRPTRKSRITEVLVFPGCVEGYDSPAQALTSGTSGCSRGYSTIAVAERNETTWWQAIRIWSDRFWVKPTAPRPAPKATAYTIDPDYIPKPARSHASGRT
jgi:hypothetical protein